MGKLQTFLKIWFTNTCMFKLLSVGRISSYMTYHAEYTYRTAGDRLDYF